MDGHAVETQFFAIEQNALAFGADFAIADLVCQRLVARAQRRAVKLGIGRAPQLNVCLRNSQLDAGGFAYGRGDRGFQTQLFDGNGDLFGHSLVPSLQPGGDSNHGIVTFQPGRSAEVLDVNAGHENEFHGPGDAAVVVPIAADARHTVFLHDIVHQYEEPVAAIQILGDAKLKRRVAPLVAADCHAVEVDLGAIGDGVKTEKGLVVLWNVRQLEVECVVRMSIVPFELREFLFPSGRNLRVPHACHIEAGEEAVWRALLLPPRLLPTALVGIGVKLPGPVEGSFLAIMGKYGCSPLFVVSCQWSVPDQRGGRRLGGQCWRG